MRLHVTVELRRPRWVPRGYKGLAFLFAFVLMVAMPLGVLASDRFSDVPTSSIFHNNINAIAGAGVTQGCGAGLYCPTDAVTREQMAAFLHRGLGRAAAGAFMNTAITATPADLSVLTIKAGEATGGTVFIKLDGYVTTYTQATTGCSCQTTYWIALDGGAVSDQYFNEITNVAIPGGYALDSGAVGWVVSVPSGTTQTFRLRAYLFGGGTHSAEGQLFATMVPFGSQGTSAP